MPISRPLLLALVGVVLIGAAVLLTRGGDGDAGRTPPAASTPPGTLQAAEPPTRRPGTRKVADRPASTGRPSGLPRAATRALDRGRVAVVLLSAPALVSAGVPMLEAIGITGRTAGNKVVEEAMDGVHESVMRGQHRRADARGARDREVPVIFPAMVTQMVAVGEETGALDTMFSKIADFYEDEVDAAVKPLTSILEPLMIIVVGAIVGFIVIAMYMPQFEVHDQIK